MAMISADGFEIFRALGSWRCGLSVMDGIGGLKGGEVVCLIKCRCSKGLCWRGLGCWVMRSGLKTSGDMAEYPSKLNEELSEGKKGKSLGRNSLGNKPLGGCGVYSIQAGFCLPGKL